MHPAKGKMYCVLIGVSLMILKFETTEKLGMHATNKKKTYFSAQIILNYANGLSNREDGVHTPGSIYDNLFNEKRH